MKRKSTGCPHSHSLPAWTQSTGDSTPSEFLLALCIERFNSFITWILFCIFYHFTITFIFFQGLIWTRGAVMRTTTSQVRCRLITSRINCGQPQPSSCLVNKPNRKSSSFFFFFAQAYVFHVVQSEYNLFVSSVWYFQASRVNRLCGTLATRCTLTSSLPTWSTCL